MCTIYSTHNPYVRVWTHQSVHTPLGHFSCCASILWELIKLDTFRTSNYHDNIRLNIMFVFLPDSRSIMISIMNVFLLRHRSIMITIMIVFLPRNVHVRTIVKGKGYPPMHEHTIMHEIPTFFHFYYHLIQPR